MNSTMFKNLPSKQKEDLESERKSMDGLGLRIQKYREHSARQILRKIGSISGALAVPTVLGIALGMWMDTLWPSDHSWLSACFPFGILLGCLIAALWVSQDKGGTA